jgi:tetratricopeptide (TPR) repeat protein
VEHDTIRGRIEAADAAVKRGDLPAAWAALEAALAADPRHLRALDYAGFVLFFLGRFAEAEAMCVRALEVAPDHAYAMKGLGLCVARQGRVDEGVASLRRAIAREPAWFDPYWDLGVVLRDAGRRDEALAVLDEGARAVPSKKADFEAFRRELGG